MRTIAAVTALSMGLSGCAWIIEEECGPEPQLTDPGRGGWEDCRADVEEDFLIGGGIAGFLAILIVLALASGDGGSGDDHSGGGTTD